jgi:hypothetical protein
MKQKPKQYLPDHDGLLTRLPDMEDRTNACVKLFPIGTVGWYIKAESTQCGRLVKQKLCLSRMAMEALASMWVKLENKRIAKESK